MNTRGLPHSSHWGTFSVLLRGEGIEVVPHPQDSDPSALLGNIPASVSHPARIGKPVVTSTQAVLWRLLRLAGVETPIHGFGRLLREH